MKSHHVVIYDDAHGHPGVDRCERCHSNSARTDWREVCEGAKAQWWRSGWSRKYRKIGVIGGDVFVRLVRADTRWTIANHSLHNHSSGTGIGRKHYRHNDQVVARREDAPPAE